MDEPDRQPLTAARGIWVTVAVIGVIAGASLILLLPVVALLWLDVGWMDH